MAYEVEGPIWAAHIIDTSSDGADGVKLCDVNGDGLPDVVTGWEEGGLTRICFHPGKETVREPWPSVTVGTTPNVEDAVAVDLDEDGTLDVVSCCEGKQRKMFVHWGPQDSMQRLNPREWKQAMLPASEDRMQWMFAWGMQVDGKHGIDIIAGGKNENAQLGWFEAPPSPRNLEGFQWHVISPVGWLMSLWQRDMNQDGHTDLVISDRYGELRACRWLQNPGPGLPQQQPWQNHFMGGRDKEVLSMCLVDLDRDGLEDAIVAEVAPRLLYLRRLEATGDRWESYEIHVRGNVGDSRAVAVGDINSDGRQDLALTTANSSGKHAVVWLEYEDSPLKDQWRTHAISGNDAGEKYDRLELLDLDFDGDLDLLTCEERQGGHGLGVVWYENPHKSGNTYK
ncbi:FG-GAP repeat domain-containing protein [Bythopirellula polymerisocia]|uniref:FG-GAP repeat protein n=1 Tax=Bythopirellula polymerisocia TaxID=2528003 RepID=A0A5C6CSF0_9BACT|nr:VCBS repeat-containing protein [Bythopirellula polymerisocia]TWU27873.1 FG-GAP repeat protein [Bythopirellula polymerisocia]